VNQATGVITLFGIGSFFGLLFGGAAGQFLHNKRPRRVIVLLVVAEWIGVLPLYLLLNAVNGRDDLGIAMFYAFMSGFFASITGPNCRAVLQNTTLPDQRGAAFAIMNTFDDLGKGERRDGGGGGGGGGGGPPGRTGQHTAPPLSPPISLLTHPTPPPPQASAPS
jgi:MFS family permease